MQLWRVVVTDNLKDYIDIFIEALKEGVMITCLVITMMLLIEFLNIESSGAILKKIKGSKLLQILTGCLLGIIPGCVGGFAGVSLYTHGILGFGALCSTMICSTGDETFAIIGTMPKVYPLLLLSLVGIALITGGVIELLRGRKGGGNNCYTDSYELHDKEERGAASIFKVSSYRTLLHPGKKRVILLIAISLFIISLLTGVLEENSFAINVFGEHWINIIFGAVACITLLLTATAEEHFIKEHIWGHVIKRHLLSIFLWTFIALLLCGILIHKIDIDLYATNYLPVVILLAVGIGLIPQSGPHLIFVMLCASGELPLYVLLASSIAQQGHVSLPLLAESGRSWLSAKLLCALVALVIGFAGMLIS